MIKSNNFNSTDNLSAFSSTLNAAGPTTLPVEVILNDSNAQPSVDVFKTTNNNSELHTNNDTSPSESTMEGTSLAAQQLTAGLLQSYGPPIAKAKEQLKELIQKQNKIYVDLSVEKFKLDNAEIAKLHEMMKGVKVYREKLLNIKKQMQNIYQRTKVLKRRAINIQTCKEKELQRRLQKQQHEESLIGKQPQ